MERVFYKDALREQYKETGDEEIRKIVRDLQGCAVTFEEEEIRAVCRRMLHLGKAEKKKVEQDEKLRTLYLNIRGWLEQKVKRLGANAAENKAVLNDLLWNVSPYWIDFRLGLKEKNKGGKK